MSPLKSSENIQKKEGVPDRSVSKNEFSFVFLNELALLAFGISGLRSSRPGKDLIAVLALPTTLVHKGRHWHCA